MLSLLPQSIVLENEPYFQTMVQKSMLQLQESIFTQPIHKIKDHTKNFQERVWQRAQNTSLTSSQAKNLLKKYPQSVQSDAGKDIAASVDVLALLREIYTPIITQASPKVEV